MYNIIVHPGGLVHVCVLYSNTGYAAERSIIVDDLVPLITEDIKDKIEVSYVEYTDMEELNSLYLFGIRLFISALNSNQCLLLKNTFFDSHPDAIHLNSFSTSTEFTTTFNLLRNLTPDSYTARLYAKIMETTSPIILYDSTSSWSTGLKNDIIDAWSGTVVVIEVNLEDYVTILEGLIPPSTATIVLLEDTNSTQILQNIFASTIPYAYNLLLGDALAQYQFPTLATNLQAHNALLIQSYITQQQITYAQDINLILNQPEHPASNLLIYFKQLFDIAILHSNEKRNYVDLYLSDSFDSTNGQYSIMPYDNNGKPVEYGYGLVDDTNVIIGTIV